MKQTTKTLIFFIIFCISCSLEFREIEEENKLKSDKTNIPDHFPVQQNKPFHNNYLEWSCDNNNRNCIPL